MLLILVLLASFDDKLDDGDYTPCTSLHFLNHWDSNIGWQNGGACIVRSDRE